MKLKNLFFTLLLLSPLLSANAATEVVIYSDDSYSPYAYADKSGRASGIYTKIIQQAFQLIPEYKVRIVPLPWKRAMNTLEKKEGIAVFPPYYRPIERPFIGEYSEPLLTENIVVFARKGSDKEKRKIWPADWLDQKIGIFLGTIDIAGPELAKAHQNNKVTIIETVSNEENLLKLARGEIDVYVNDRFAILHTLDNLKKNGKWSLSFPELEEVAIVSSENAYLAFARPDEKFPYQKDLIAKFNKAIKKLKKENKIQPIIDQVL